MYTKVAKRWSSCVWSYKTDFRKYLSLDSFICQMINGSGRLFSGIKTWSCGITRSLHNWSFVTSSMSVIAIKPNKFNRVSFSLLIYKSFTVWNIFCLTTVHLNLFNPLWKLKVSEIKDIRLYVESMLNDKGDTLITRLTIV